MSIIKIFANSNYISVNRDIIKLLGIHEALLLGELCSEYSYYESQNQLTQEEWFYSTSENITNQIGLSKFQQLEALKTLTKNNIIEKKTAGMPAKRYFKINTEKLLQILDNKKSNNLTTRSQKIRQQEVKKLDTNINNITLINNINNKEKYKKENQIEIINNDFEIAWSLYGKIGNKKQAEKSFVKAIKSVSVDIMQEGIQNYLNYLESIRTPTFYPIKHFATWLNNEGWKDTYPIYQNNTHNVMSYNFDCKSDLDRIFEDSF